MLFSLKNIHIAEENATVIWVNGICIAFMSECFVPIRNVEMWPTHIWNDDKIYGNKKKLANSDRHLKSHILEFEEVVSFKYLGVTVETD